MTRTYDILLAVDAETSRTVWHRAYREWPRMIPDTPSLAVFNWTGNSEVTPVQINNFEVINVSSELIATEPPSAEEKQRLTLLQKKCKICWSWLIQLNDLSRTVSGYLPDVPIGKPGSNDRELFEKEHQRMKDMIAEEISVYHSKIWTAQSETELEEVVVELVHLRHGNVQAYK